MKNSLFLLMASFFLFACGDRVTYTATVDQPAPLINGILSYQSIESIKSKITPKGYEWSVIENSKLAQGDRRPPFNIFTVSIKNYQSIGHQGELIFTFFNDRLMSSCFYPTDVTSFIIDLKNHSGVDGGGPQKLDNVLSYKSDQIIWRI